MRRAGRRTLSKFLVGAVALAFGAQAFADPKTDEINKAIKEKGAKWVAKETSVHKLSDEEKVKRLGARSDRELSGPVAAAPSAGDVQASYASSSAVPTLDYRNHNGASFVSSVRDQGSCGSCWVFGTVAALESQLMMSGANALPDNAEQIVLSCTPKRSLNGIVYNTCRGGWSTDAAMFLRDSGAPGESAFPYAGSDLACANAGTAWKTYADRIQSYVNVSATVAALESALQTYGPIVVQYTVYSDFYSYGGGVYRHVTGSSQGDHIVALVGYDSVNRYFIAKNSWGADWGEAGFFRIDYSEVANGSVNFGKQAIAYTSSTALPKIGVVAPGGNSIAAGSTVSIKWNYQGSVGSTVSIDLYKGGAAYARIASGASIGSSGSGSYGWSIPAGQPSGSDYQVVVTSESSSSVSGTGSFFSVVSTAEPTPSPSPSPTKTPKGRRK